MWDTSLKILNLLLRKLTVLCGLLVASSPAFAQSLSGNYEMVNANSGLALEVYGRATTNGANVDQWEENGGANQQWTFSSLGSGLYQIVNVNSGLALEVSGSGQSASDGANVDQWAWLGGSNQQWRVSSIGNGLYQIINANSGLALQVSGSGITNGINVDQWSWQGAANQEWWILPVVSTVPAGTLTPASGGSGAAASTFHGFNWSDVNNFPDLLAGMDITDTYSNVETEAGVVLDAFTNVGANSVRISLFPQTVQGSWWPRYKGAIDEATSMGMKVIIVASNINGKAPDLTTFWRMWDTVVTDYNGNGNVYFEILNEPYGYSTAAWMEVVTNWLQRYPTVAHGRVFVGGTGYDQNVPVVASSSAVRGCLFSVHDYGFWHGYTNDAEYYNDLSSEVGSYVGSTVLTEYGSPMSPNIDYAAGDQDNNRIEGTIGFCNYCHSNHLGSLYFTGLAGNSGSTMFLLVTNPPPHSMAVQCPSGLQLVQYGWGLPTPPEIFNQPAIAFTNPVTLYSGVNPSFSISAGGSAPLHYQWWSSGVPIAGATNASYAPPLAATGLTNNYDCIITNSVGSVTSVVWSVTVIPPPLASYPQALLALHPVGYWPLNETPDNGSGNQGIICHDYAGGNNGVYSNVVLAQAGYEPVADPTGTAPIFGADLASNSLASQIGGINFSAPPGGNAEFSITAWVTGQPQTIDAGIVAKGYGNGGEQFDLDTGSDKLATHGFRFFVRDDTGKAYVANSTDTPDGNWHFLAAVCDESNGLVQLYIDGVDRADGAIQPGSGLLATLGGSAPGAPLMSIGSRTGSTSSTSFNNQFIGKIDQVAVFNYALNSNQVAALFAAAPVPALQAALSGGGLKITYTGTLQSSTNVAGPFAPVPGATSPFVVIPAAPQMFYRVGNP